MPTVIARDSHTISRANISRNAIRVLTQLQSAGYEAYLVGGGVRDLLLGREPKDFDVATNALPEEVKAVFKNCRLIGRRFRLAHVYFGREIIEVATFRSNQQPGQDEERHAENGMILRDNVYGTLEDDAQRRDLTINALARDEAGGLIDVCHGREDLDQGRLRHITAAFSEDPVRLLRIAHFAAKLGRWGFRVAHPTQHLMRQMAASSTPACTRRPSSSVRARPRSAMPTSSGSRAGTASRWRRRSPTRPSSITIARSERSSRHAARDS